MGASSIVGRLLEPGRPGGTLTVVTPETTDTLSWHQLHEQALGAAGDLVTRGLGPGARIGVLGPVTPRLVTLVDAAWLTGATTVLLPAPSRGMPLDRFAVATAAKAARLGLHALLYDEPSLPSLGEALGPTAVPFTSVGTGPAEPAAEISTLQLTSGTTTDSRAVVVTDANLSAYLETWGEAMGTEPDRELVYSWLPLTHDLGLFATFIFSAVLGLDLVLAATEVFGASPGSWMAAVDERRATWIMAPCFAYQVASRFLSPGLDLSSVRVAGAGAEMIGRGVIDTWTTRAAANGFPAGAMACGYGLAEATCSVTATHPGFGIGFDLVDSAALDEGWAEPAKEGAERARPLALNGPAHRGLEIRIVGAGREPLGDRAVGEIEVKGPTVSPGYLDDPASTAAAFVDGWLRTGDLGYVVGGDLVPIGRAGDVMVIAGRNLAPEVVEQAAATVDGVRPGRVIAFAVPASPTAQMVVVAECRDTDRPSRDAIARAVRDEVGINPAEIVLLERGLLPVTGSGKLQRAAARTRYLAGEYPTA